MKATLWLPLTGRVLPDGKGDLADPVRFPDGNDFARLGWNDGSITMRWLKADWGNRQVEVEIDASQPFFDWLQGQFALTPGEKLTDINRLSLLAALGMADLKV